MLSLDPDYLRSFLAIQECGSYAAAAERVNKTQSTLSAQMKRLEDALGAVLFVKDGRRNVLTPAGQRLLAYARPFVRLNDETVRAFRPPSLSGRLKIGMSDDYAQSFLPPVLTQFTRTHPAVDVEVLTASSMDLNRLTDADSFDALLLSECFAGSDYELLRSDQLHWIGSERFGRHLEETLPLALWDDGCAWRAQAIAALTQAGRAWRTVYTTSNAPLLLATVRDGLGITVGPKWYLAEGLRVLDELDRACPLSESSIGIRIMPHATESLPLKAFLDQVRVQFRNEARLAVPGVPTQRTVTAGGRQTA